MITSLMLHVTKHMNYLFVGQYADGVHWDHQFMHLNDISQNNSHM